MKTKQTLDRIAWAEQVSQSFGLLAAPLSYRAAKFAVRHSTKEDLIKWLVKPSTHNEWQMGRKTYIELCAAFGLAVPAKAPRSQKMQLVAALAKIAELEQIIHDLRIENSGQAAEIERLKGEMYK